jgi:hypothetical protein
VIEKDEIGELKHFRIQYIDDPYEECWNVEIRHVRALNQGLRPKFCRHRDEEGGGQANSAHNKERVIAVLKHWQKAQPSYRTKLQHEMQEILGK